MAVDPPEMRRAVAQHVYTTRTGDSSKMTLLHVATDGATKIPPVTLRELLSWLDDPQAAMSKTDFAGYAPGDRRPTSTTDAEVQLIIALFKPRGRKVAQKSIHVSTG